MSLVFDEYGRPFIIMREQERRERLKGLDAQKVRVHSADEAVTSPNHNSYTTGKYPRCSNSIQFATVFTWSKRHGQGKRARNVNVSTEAEALAALFHVDACES